MKNFLFKRTIVTTTKLTTAKSSTLAVTSSKTIETTSFLEQVSTLVATSTSTSSKYSTMAPMVYTISCYNCSVKQSCKLSYYNNIMNTTSKYSTSQTQGENSITDCNQIGFNKKKLFLKFK